MPLLYKCHYCKQHKKCRRRFWGVRLCDACYRGIWSEVTLAGENVGFTEEKSNHD